MVGEKWGGGEEELLSLLILLRSSRISCVSSLEGPCAWSIMMVLGVIVVEKARIVVDSQPRGSGKGRFAFHFRSE